MEALAGVNMSLLLPVLFIELFLMLIAMFDIIRIEKTNGPKWVWVLVVLFIGILGPILYFVIGRRNNG